MLTSQQLFPLLALSVCANPNNNISVLLVLMPDGFPTGDYTSQHTEFNAICQGLQMQRCSYFMTPLSGGISVSSSVKAMIKWHLFECKQNKKALLSKLKHESSNNIQNISVFK